jgi:hypothetical protein
LPSPRHLPDALMHLLPSLPLLSMHNSAYMYEDWNGSFPFFYRFACSVIVC